MRKINENGWFEAVHLAAECLNISQLQKDRFFTSVGYPLWYEPKDILLSGIMVSFKQQEVLPLLVEMVCMSSLSNS